MPLTYDKIDPQPTLLLSTRPYLPYGDASLVYGKGSLGKGRMVMSLVAAVTRGLPVGLDKLADDPGDVIVILPEDKAGEQVRHRLEAAGADLTRVFDLTRKDSGTRFKFSASAKTPGDLPVLAALIAELKRSCLCGFTGADAAELHQHLAAHPWHAPRNPRLVIIDPITAVIGEGTIQTNKGARAFVEPLQDLADVSGVHILMVAHPTKAGVLQGSGALSDALRLVYEISQDTLNSAHRIVRAVKANNLPPEYADDIRFTIATDEQGRPHVQWLTRAAIDKAANDWRAVRSAEQVVRNHLADAMADIPVKPGDPAAPWRVLRMDRNAAGTTREIVGDKPTQAGALWIASKAAGQPLAWKQKGTQYIATMQDGKGGISAFLVYDRSAAA